MSKANTTHGALALAGALLCFAPVSCKPTEKKAAASAPETSPLARQLAGARVDSAKLALTGNRRDEALLLLVSALKSNPASTEALQLIRPLLAETRWHFPVARLEVGQPVQQLAASGKSLWTSISGGAEGFDTTARWNLETFAVESVLLPRRGEQTTATVLSQSANRIVFQRGRPGDFIALLCDAQTLRPVANLGVYPTECDAAAVTAFSADGLLFAQPEAGPTHLTWHLRDSATGQTIRSSVQPNSRPPIAARFEGDNVVVTHADGSLLEIPLSPVDDPFLQELGQPAAAFTAPFLKQDRTLIFAEPLLAPVRAAEIITAVAVDQEQVFLGTQSGQVEIQRRLPLPKLAGIGMEPLHFNPAGLKTLDQLSEAISGLRFEEEARTFQPLSENDRRAALEACEPKLLTELLPGIDFTELRNTVLSTPFRTPAADATAILGDRLLRADADRPRYLALRSTESPEISVQDRFEALFKEGDSEKIVTAIKALPPKSPALPTALALAIDSDRSLWVDVALKASPDAPPMIQRLALSRIHWLEGDKADAMALWSDGFPDVEKIRRTEDWDGWESAHFARRFETLFGEMRHELAIYEIPESGSAKEREASAKLLLKPTTTRSLGRDRHAQSCLDAATALAPFPEQIDLGTKLTTYARALGAPPAKCLRVDAIALTRAGQFSRAHEAWVSLISDFPTNVQEAGDYAEAAYTAFENGNSGQAMAILGTGVFRFPHDPNFAYRAGWISLLTARWQEAYEFLRAGERIGFPAEKLEKATALLAIASAECGNTMAAGKYFDQLIAIDPGWSQPAPPKADGWPEELVATLAELSEPPKAIPVDQ